MEDWLEQMLENCNKKILQFDSEWNMQTSVCCVPLLKKRGTQYYEINHTGDSDFLQLPGAARSTKMRAAKFPDTLTAVWKMDVTGCASSASETVRLWHKPQKRKKKKPWRKSFARLHIFTSAGGDQADDGAVMSPAALQRKLQVPCLRICDARWSGSGPRAYFNSDETPLIIYWNWELFIHSFSFACILCAHILSTCILQVTFSSVYVHMLSRFKISHVSRTKWDKVKYKDTFV